LKTVEVLWQSDGVTRSAMVTLGAPEEARAPHRSSSSQPVVVLLHGTSGTVDDMESPEIHPGFNAERIDGTALRSRGRHWYPNAGYWHLGVDAMVPVRGWGRYLRSLGFPTVNWGQIDPKERLGRTTTEALAVIRALAPGGVLAAASTDLAERPIVLMGHSRGGILARRLLVELAQHQDGLLERITHCITLQAPNQGTQMADMALTVARGLRTARDGAKAALDTMPLGPVDRAMAKAACDAATDFVLANIESAAYHDYKTTSATLNRLRAAEPVFGVDYFSFGGTRPRLMGITGWEFDASSGVPSPVEQPPFHWLTWYRDLLPLPPSLPLKTPIPELNYDEGDILVSAQRARLPFSVHRNYRINHAEGLWFPLLQMQVASILRGAHLPEEIVVGCVTRDSAADGDRTIDGFGGFNERGQHWWLSMEEALMLDDLGATLYLKQRSQERPATPLGVHKRGTTRYFRAPNGSSPSLATMPKCNHR
jgi:hypothetical protein